VPTPLPPEVTQLLWEHDAAAVSLETHSLLILERVMTRGSLNAMRWLWATVPHATLQAYVEGPGLRSLPPREAVFWRTMLGVPIPASARIAGGGRPGWTR
jgi:hypothetical protein